MNMVSLFRNLADVEKSMMRDPRSMCADQLEEIDNRHEAAWKAVLEFDPPNTELRELMLLMLLDKLEGLAADGESCVRVREKILSLFETREMDPANTTTIGTAERRKLQVF